MSFIFINNLKHNKKILYVIANIILILTFGIIYWLIDILSNKYIFFNKLFNIKINNKPNNTLSYYIWFSFITQTTVGYKGLVNYKNEELNYNKEFNILQFINILQLISIILVPLILI